MSSTLIAWSDELYTRFAQWRRAFDARTRRERVLLIGAAVAVIWMLADSVWLAPAVKSWGAARSHRIAANVAITHLKQAMATSDDAESQLHGEIAQWQQRVNAGERDLRALRATLVGASDMVPMLARLLTQVGGVRLRSMRSLERTEVGAMTTAAPSDATTGRLYRHGIALEVEGSYADVLAYLRAIETMPQRVILGGMQFKVEHFPVVVLSLRLYTISEDRDWLEI